MGFFDKGHEKESPIGNLRAHIGTFMYFVKVGKSKFKHKGKVGEIFADMDNTQYLFQQATSGTMYDMKKKLDYTLWDAATHKYTEDIQKLKDELLKAVDEGEESGEFAEEKKEKQLEGPHQGPDGGSGGKSPEGSGRKGKRNGNAGSGNGRGVFDGGRLSGAVAYHPGTGKRV